MARKVSNGSGSFIKYTNKKRPGDIVKDLIKEKIVKNIVEWKTLIVYNIVYENYNN
jgi:hypothetical protein